MAKNSDPLDDALVDGGDDEEGNYEDEGSGLLDPTHVRQLASSIAKDPASRRIFLAALKGKGSNGGGREGVLARRKRRYKQSNENALRHVRAFGDCTHEDDFLPTPSEEVLSRIQSSPDPDLLLDVYYERWEDGKLSKHFLDADYEDLADSPALLTH